MNMTINLKKTNQNLYYFQFASNKNQSRIYFLLFFF